MDRLEPSLEQMPIATMPTIAGLGKYAVQQAHPFLQVSVGRLDHQMIVIAHQTIGVADPVEFRQNIRQR